MALNLGQKYRQARPNRRLPRADRAGAAYLWDKRADVNRPVRPATPNVAPAARGSICNFGATYADKFARPLTRFIAQMQRAAIFAESQSLM